MLKAVVEELTSLLMNDVNVMCNVKNGNVPMGVTYNVVGKKNAILRALTSYPSYLVDLKIAFDRLSSFLTTFDCEKVLILIFFSPPFPRIFLPISLSYLRLSPTLISKPKIY